MRCISTDDYLYNILDRNVKTKKDSVPLLIEYQPLGKVVIFTILDGDLSLLEI